jgi:hypothetical protein
MHSCNQTGRQHSSNEEFVHMYDHGGSTLRHFVLQGDSKATITKRTNIKQLKIVMPACVPLATEGSMFQVAPASAASDEQASLRSRERASEFVPSRLCSFLHITVPTYASKDWLHRCFPSHTTSSFQSHAFRPLAFEHRRRGLSSAAIVIADIRRGEALVHFEVKHPSHLNAGHLRRVLTLSVYHTSIIQCRFCMAENHVSMCPGPE